MCLLLRGPTQIKLELMQFLAGMRVSIPDEFVMPAFQIIGIARPTNNPTLSYRRREFK